jgi:hypothetical protein
MKLRGSIVPVLMLCASVSAAIAQSSGDTDAGREDALRLGDIMIAAQMRHMKLWFAGRAGNWELAAFELRLLKTGLEAAANYPDISASNIVAMETPVQSLADAINAKDARRFAAAFGELTSGCNTCHKSMGQGFIVMRVPIEQPFANQLFPPQGRP